MAPDRVVAKETAVAVCAVGDGSGPAPARDLSETAAWYDAISGGRWSPRVIRLPPVSLEHSIGRYQTSRGIGASGPTSQHLVDAVVARMDGDGRAGLRAADGRLALVVPGDIHPHVWHPLRGGIALGAGAWCRRYAILPATSALGVIAHELAHLLLGWRDCEGDGTHCLMGLGGLRGGGATPRPPCAALLRAAGWRRSMPIDRWLTVHALTKADEAVGVLVWNGRTVVVDVRDDVLLAGVERGMQPRHLAAIPVAGQGDVSVLGLMATSLRRRLGSASGPAQ